MNRTILRSMVIAFGLTAWGAQAQPFGPNGNGGTGNARTPGMGGIPSEATRVQFAQKMVPLLDEEQGLLREKLALIDAKKAQLLAPYDNARALALREQERDLMRRFQNLVARRRAVLGLPAQTSNAGASGVPMGTNATDLAPDRDGTSDIGMSLP